MTLQAFPPGLLLDAAPLSARPYWRFGYNIRFRDGQLETVGLHGKVRDVDGDALSATGAQVRTLFPTPSDTAGQILAASVDTVTLVDFDPTSTSVTGTRWRTADVTPTTGYTAPSDAVADPAEGRIAIPPTWWFADQDDVVVGQPGNVVGMPCFSWDRDRTNRFAALANSPTGAVGGGVVGRILVLLGCTSFTDPDPGRQMVIRWSDRYDFESWTPSDVNVSGELLLDGGTRIVGGGAAMGGIVAWTDRRMAFLTETGDPDSVFARRYVDGGRGLLCNRGWCEADGTIWWMDETRTLNMWEGGRPQQVPNSMRLGTVERLSDAQIARAYMVPNHEFGEVIFWYPDPDDASETLWIGLVFNYLDKAWSIWRFDRPAWGPRAGAIRSIAADSSNALFFHDLDVALDAAHRPLLDFQDPANDAIAPETYDWGVESCMLTTGSPQDSSLRLTRYLLDHIPMGRPGWGDDDAFTLAVNSYGEPLINSSPVTDRKEIARGTTTMHTRAQGKALRIVATGVAHRTVWRFGQSDMKLAEGGQR